MHHKYVGQDFIPYIKPATRQIHAKHLQTLKKTMSSQFFATWQAVKSEASWHSRWDRGCEKASHDAGHWQSTNLVLIQWKKTSSSTLPSVFKKGWPFPSLHNEQHGNSNHFWKLPSWVSRRHGVKAYVLLGAQLGSAIQFYSIQGNMLHLQKSCLRT